MKILPRKCCAFTLVELLVVIVIIAVLIMVALPQRRTGTDNARMTETLANARSLQQATQMMTLDHQQLDGDGVHWTVMISKKETSPITLATYLAALEKDNYMTGQELRKVLSAPGKQPQVDSFSAENIAFKIFQVEDTSPSDQPFVATANVTPGGSMDAGADPYGNKGFIVFNKGGGGGIFKRATDAANTNVFPTDNVDPGLTPYRYITLK